MLTGTNILIRLYGGAVSFRPVMFLDTPFNWNLISTLLS